MLIRLLNAQMTTK